MQACFIHASIRKKYDMYNNIRIINVFIGLIFLLYNSRIAFSLQITDDNSCYYITVSTGGT